MKQQVNYDLKGFNFGKFMLFVVIKYDQRQIDIIFVINLNLKVKDFVIFLGKKNIE